jgi:hypothetical protein
MTADTFERLHGRAVDKLPHADTQNSPCADAR